ncbi:C-type lectin domain-containing protein [Archangium violaceum]|uniref:C-type lectin domain-containing protein n=1 Tax=Archangium violaceum TaxID=83451 RepID=UPI00193C56C1|nr:C-type lectin domain-containing protein [Archangium violaceum]QRK08254.1 C-type lectin domain-containing protein [Archangium violaceum]
MERAWRAGLLAAVVAAGAGCGAGLEAPAEGQETTGPKDVITETQAVSRDRHDYLFVLSPRSWHEARQSCRSRGYDLVTIDDPDEEEWLHKEEILRGGQPWWVGLHKTDEDLWVWPEQDVPAAYTNWSPGEPNNADGVEACAVDNWGDGAWNDAVCWLEAYFICERANEGSTQSFSFTATGTRSARENTVDQPIELQAGQLVTFGTCGVPGASTNGDTYLRLVDPTGQEVASNDDGCKGFGSNFSFVARTPGAYVIRAGCYADSSCGGTVVISY